MATTSSLSDLVRDVLETHRGDWLTLTQIRQIVTDILVPPGRLRDVCYQIRASSSVQSRSVDSVRWWQDDLRPQQVIELRVTWPQD